MRRTRSLNRGSDRRVSSSGSDFRKPKYQERSEYACSSRVRASFLSPSAAKTVAIRYLDTWPVLERARVRPRKASR